MFQSIRAREEFLQGFPNEPIDFGKVNSPPVKVRGGRLKMGALGVFVLKKCFLWFLWVYFCAVNSTKLLMIKVPKLKHQNSI